MARPNPEDVLAGLAGWFDNPNESPAVVVEIGGKRYTPGMLLREILDAYRQRKQEATK